MLNASSPLFIGVFAIFMLNERLGAGPIMFKYWSGLYTRGAQSLVVSNGVGNWFPVRAHAPAEMTQITLRAVE